MTNSTGFLLRGGPAPLHSKAPTKIHRLPCTRPTVLEHIPNLFVNNNQGWKTQLVTFCRVVLSSSTLRTTKHPPYSRAVREVVFLVSLCTCQNTSEPYSKNLTRGIHSKNVRAEGTSWVIGFCSLLPQSPPTVSSLSFFRIMLT